MNNILDGPHRLLNTAVDPIEPHLLDATQPLPRQLNPIPLTQAQRDAMERAFWRSVEILDAGGYGHDQEETWPPWDPSLPANRQGPFAVSRKPMLVELSVFEALNAHEGIGCRRSSKAWLR